MSYSALVFFRDGSPCGEDVMFRNSHGSAPFVWSSLCQKYLDERFAWLHEIQGWWTELLGKCNDVERAVLLCTAEAVVVESADFAWIADHIEEFLAWQYTPNVVNHWPAYASAIRSSDAEAVGWYHSSCGDHPFRSWRMEGDEEVSVLTPLSDLPNIRAELAKVAPHEDAVREWNRAPRRP